MEELSSTFMLPLNSVIQVNHDRAPLTKHINTQTALRFGRENCQDKLNGQLPTHCPARSLMNVKASST